MKERMLNLLEVGINTSRGTYTSIKGLIIFFLERCENSKVLLELALPTDHGKSLNVCLIS